MEVSLRKPQRLLFKKMTGGAYVRMYRKSVTASRSYWRLMDAKHNPIQNITAGTMKPFFQLSLLDEISHGQYKLKEGIVLIDKRKKAKVQ